MRLRRILLFVAVVLVAGCTSGSGDDDEVGRDPAPAEVVDGGPTDGIGILSGDVVRDLGSCAGCVPTGQVVVDHPSWGHTHIVSMAARSACGGIELVALDDQLQERWRYTVDPECFYELAPVHVLPGATVSSPVDATGKAYFAFNPGRYDGVIVLAPVPDGFEDFGSLPGVGFYATRFDHARVVDVDDDDVYEVELSETDCVPSCAEASTWTTLHAWDGADFAVVVPTTPTACGDLVFDASGDVAAEISATGVVCAEARHLVEQVGPPATFTSATRHFTTDGYDCSMRTERPASLRGEVVCEADSRRVSWTAAREAQPA